MPRLNEAQYAFALAGVLLLALAAYWLIREPYFNAIAPNCAAGQIVVTDGDGNWVCAER